MMKNLKLFYYSKMSHYDVIFILKGWYNYHAEGP